MKSRKYKIIDPVGIHARPASTIVNVANKFKCESTITYKNKTVNLNSILSIMSLGIMNNSEITITTNGNQEEEAINTIEKELREKKLIK